MTTSRKLLTTREVAELLGLSPATVLRRWRADEIPGYRLASNASRFDSADIDEYLAAFRRGGRTEEVSATGGES